IADHLDVDRSELAEERDAVRTDRAEDEPDRVRGNDADHAGRHRALEAFPELVAVVPDHGPFEGRKHAHAAIKYEWPPRGGHSLSLSKRGLGRAVVLRRGAARVAGLDRRARSG